MSVASLNPEELSGEHVKIGAPSHTVRNLALLGGLILVGAGGWAFYRWSAAEDAQKLASLESFRASFADKCEASGWRGAAPTLVRDTYLNSQQLQDVIAFQQKALDKGQSCEDVLKALKAADFPLPQKTAGEQ